MLLALLRQLGCDVTDLGAVPDDPDAIRDAMQRGLSHDLLVTSGGISMGDADHVPGIARQLGVSLYVSKLRIKPGKPFLYGTAGACHFFGLPGNPVSAFCCTHRLVSRTVARLRGATIREPWREALLADDLSANGPREFYMPAVLESGRVRALHWKGSADVFTLSKANALLVRAADDPPRRSGEQVRVWELR
jgi:molybdopterin molybdotransferase